MDGFIHSFMGPFVLLASFPFSLRPYSFIRWFVRLLVRCFVRSFIHLQFRVGVEDEGLDAGVLHKAQQRHDQHRVVPQLLVRFQRLAAELLEWAVAAFNLFEGFNERLRQSFRGLRELRDFLNGFGKP